MTRSGYNFTGRSDDNVLPMWNPRYANYARANGNTPAQQLVEDRKKWPGGVMCGFTLWNSNRIRNFASQYPALMFMGTIAEKAHAFYDMWLSAYVDAKLGAQQRG